MTTLPARLALLALAAFVILIPFTTYAQQSEQSNIHKNLEFPHWSFTKEMIFPADRSLLRPEDGVILPDGRLIVADQAHGLRLIQNDGVHRPFGRFAAAGYIHPPPEAAGGANGVTLEPDGTHILVSDIHHGSIYRVDVDSEETELLYQHAFGVNMARLDRKGGMWFSQSTRNTPESGEARLFAALESPLPDGAVYYLPPAYDYQGGSAIRVADSLYFANGIVLDEQAGHLYVAETMGHRVQRFRIDHELGRLTNRSVVLKVLSPDNIELDTKGQLWIASVIKSEIKIFDLKSVATGSILQVSTPKSTELIPEIERRIAADISFLELFGPDLWEPAPGAITGMILSPDGGSHYVTNLGNALIRLEPLNDTASLDTALKASSPLVGTWGLISMDRHFDDGRVEPHMGEDPSGRLVYDEAGRMIVYLAGRDRAQFVSSVRSTATPQELKNAFDTQISYFGTYSLDEEAGTVTHHIESAWYPNWSGGQQIRFFELEGDRIRLSTPPILIDGIVARVHLIWERLH